MQAKYRKYTNKYMYYLRILHTSRDYNDPRRIKKILCYGDWKTAKTEIKLG